MDLILHSYGAALQVEKGVFKAVSDKKEQMVAPSDVRCIRIGRHAQVTSAALLLAIEQGIDVILESFNGQPIGRVWSVKYGSIGSLRKAQALYAQTDDALRWVCELLRAKAEMQIAILNTFVFDERFDKAIERRIAKIEKRKKEFNPKRFSSLRQAEDQLRGIEGNISREYFRMISMLVPEQYAFQSRSSRPAKDAFNCMLNYCYGILYNLIEAGLTSAGLDPYMGVLHADQYNAPALAFDVIERFRGWIDVIIVNLCRLEVIYDDFFTVDEEAWQLNEFGKQIIVTAVNEHLDEVITFEGRQLSRRKHIDAYCTRLASRFRTNVSKENKAS